MGLDWAAQVRYGWPRKDFNDKSVLHAVTAGTDSMKHALKTLGFGEIYHMKDLLRGHVCTVDHMDTVWRALAQGGGRYNATDIRDKLSCFGGGVDYPVSPFFKELMDVYPTAKVRIETPKTDENINH